MKMTKLIVGLVVCALSPFAAAKPIWCAGGSELEADHPLSRESLSVNDRSPTSLVATLNRISAALEDNVSSIGLSTGFVSTDANDLNIFRNTMQQVVSAIQNEGVIESVRFNPGSLQAAGLTTVTCFPLTGDVSTPGPVLKSIYYAAYTARSFAEEAQADPRRESLAFIEERTNEFNAWILGDESLAQWPWEMYINGKRLSDDFSKPAPLTQVIAMRPSAGLNLSFASQEEADAVPAFAFEPVGFIRYSDHTYKKHKGVSLLVTIGSENGAGYGLAFRYNGYWAGYTVGSGDTDDAVFVGVDLYNYIKSESARNTEKSEFVNRLVEALNKN